jgi:hypothetical protein
VPVSLFYTFYGAADASSDAIRAVMASAVGGTVGDDGSIVRDGMHVTAYRVEPAEAHATTGHFGFEHRVTAIFTFANLASADVADHNTALMAEAVVAFLEAFPGRGVLLFNGEEVILQRLDDGIEFGADWEDWAELPGVRPLVARHAVRALAQPLR